MVYFANGRKIDVPANENGQVKAGEVRRAMEIPDDRMLIAQMPSGENQVVPKKGRFTFPSGQHFMDAPPAIRGKAYE